jgi:hypothetical protein
MEPRRPPSPQRPTDSPATSRRVLRPPARLALQAFALRFRSIRAALGSGFIALAPMSLSAPTRVVVNRLDSLA